MIEIISFKKTEKGSLQGFLNIKIKKWGDFIIKDICVFEKNGKKWINFPSRMYEDNGEKKYMPYCSFEDAKIKAVFEQEVLKSLEAFLKTMPEKSEDTKNNNEIPF